MLKYGCNNNGETEYCERCSFTESCKESNRYVFDTDGKTIIRESPFDIDHNIYIMDSKIIKDNNLLDIMNFILNRTIE